MRGDAGTAARGTTTATGEDGADAWRDRMGELHEAFRFAVARLDAVSALAHGWTVDTAADWAWARCQPSAWRHLVMESGWRCEEFARRSVTSIAAELLNAPSGNV